MIKILTISLGVSPVLAVGICFVITVVYSVAAGLWAVLWTDLIQFVIKMRAVIILAVYVVQAVGGIDAHADEARRQHFGTEAAALSVLPCLGARDGIAPTPGCRCSRSASSSRVQWWAAWYPGAEPGGGGYIAQRIFSARSERDGVLATLFFQVAHYAIGRGRGSSPDSRQSILYPESRRQGIGLRSRLRRSICRRRGAAS